jgi:hypothetical protein
MKRKDFLKILSFGASIASVSPMAMVMNEKQPIEPSLPIEIDIYRIPDGMSLADFIKIWRQSGVLAYKDKK